MSTASREEVLNDLVVDHSTEYVVYYIMRYVFWEVLFSTIFLTYFKRVEKVSNLSRHLLKNIC